MFIENVIQNKAKPQRGGMIIAGLPRALNHSSKTFDQHAAPLGLPSPIPKKGKWFSRTLTNSSEGRTMAKNPILEELYEIRSKILAEHSHDLGDYMICEFERLKSEGHPIARIKQRNICYSGAAKFCKPKAEERTSALGE